jgi:hypothetical protein
MQGTMGDKQRQCLEILVLSKAQQDFRKVVSAHAFSTAMSRFLKAEELQIATSKPLAKLINPRTTVWFVNCESFEI